MYDSGAAETSSHKLNRTWSVQTQQSAKPLAVTVPATLLRSLPVRPKHPVTVVSSVWCCEAVSDQPAVSRPIFCSLKTITITKYTSN